MTSGYRAARAGWRSEKQIRANALCARSALDPDAWFPASADADAARREADAAIRVCAACPVRAACLSFSLEHWKIGQHGVWGGLVAADRAALRQRQLAAQVRASAAFAASVAEGGAWRTPGPPARTSPRLTHYGKSRMR
jgi:WhiB family transcriptional regulator, redox-sensing transcriptional regulator